MSKKVLLFTSGIWLEVKMRKVEGIETEVILGCPNGVGLSHIKSMLGKFDVIVVDWLKGDGPKLVRQLRDGGLGTRIVSAGWNGSGEKAFAEAGSDAHWCKDQPVDRLADLILPKARRGS